jgi:putative transposase
MRDMNIPGEWPCWGKFRVLHTDNAKEFRGTVIGRACEEHDITIEHRPKGMPHYGGHVERGFRTFMKRIHSLKGTTFSDIKERAKYDSSGRAILTRAELERWFTSYIAKYYPNKFHRGIKDTPLARFKAGIVGKDGFMGIGLPERVPNPRRFMLDFMPYREATVQDYGILINHVHYYDDALRNWIKATDPDNPGKTRKFIVRYIPRDMREVYFFDPDTEDYIAIPYRNRSYPPASYWEIEAAAARLRTKGMSHVNEDLIFESIDEMREIEQEAERLTKRARREREKRKRQPKLPAPIGTPSLGSTPPRGESPDDGSAEEVEEPLVSVEAFDGIVEPD